MNLRRPMLAFSTATVLVASLSLSQVAFAQADDGATKADNSARNKEHRDSAQPTADQQKNNKTDLEITRDIRRAVIKDKSLSTYAHNVKIIAQAGSVTLKGPVRSDDEKTKVEKLAADTVGSDKVTSQLEVKQ